MLQKCEGGPLISLCDVYRDYRVGTHSVRALNGVSLEVPCGEFLAIVGPSGSGKSSILNLLGGLDRPTSGRVHVGTVDLARASEAQLVQYRRLQVGFIFQSFNLLAFRSAAENVQVPLTLAGVRPQERRQRSMELLGAVGLADRAGHHPNQMSGGEMQRVAVARSLANRPSLILADEPTGNLDSKTGKVILELLRAAVKERGVTLILVTHDSDVARHADRIIHMADGRISQVELTTNFRAGYHAGEVRS